MAEAEHKLIPQDHGGALLPGGKKGNKGGDGRPSGSGKRQREQFLNELLSSAIVDKDAKDGETEGEERTLEDEVRQQLAAKVLAGDAQTIRWLVEMQHGSPRATIVQEVSETAFVERAIQVAAEFMDEDQFKGYCDRMAAEFGEGD
jgi:hypothetical protein